MSASSLPAPQGLCALRAARMLAGISQAQLGQVVGRDHSWVSRLESGEAEASPTEQVKIAEALGVPVGVAFPEDVEDAD